MTKRALTGTKIFDGLQFHHSSALLMENDVCVGVVMAKYIPPDYAVTQVDGGIIMPGFVDLQVNGGGGVMFNDDPSVETLRTMAKAHASTGTVALLPTLITDTRDCMRAAVDAVQAAVHAKVPGIVGIHLEGPHLSVAKKGAHDPSLIRRMEDADVAFLLDAAERLPNVMVTVAPENTTLEQINQLAAAGVIVSLGHTDCSFDQAQAAFNAGARCVTHLFNAMSQLGSREPGLVGAALATEGVSAGLIVDDIHVHASSLQIALWAEKEVDGFFLVTDAMATAGSEITEFMLNGRKVLRQDGRLTLEDGTLAGADLDFPKAISNLVKKVGISPNYALGMATLMPAKRLRVRDGVGCFLRGYPANAIYLDDDFVYLGRP